MRKETCLTPLLRFCSAVCYWPMLTGTGYTNTFSCRFQTFSCRCPVNGSFSLKTISLFLNLFTFETVVKSYRFRSFSCRCKVKTQRKVCTENTMYFCIQLFVYTLTIGFIPVSKDFFVVLIISLCLQ